MYLWADSLALSSVLILKPRLSHPSPLALLLEIFESPVPVKSIVLVPVDVIVVSSSTINVPPDIVVHIVLADDIVVACVPIE